jgi:hypothetical protein
MMISDVEATQICDIADTRMSITSQKLFIERIVLAQRDTNKPQRFRFPQSR